MWKIIPLFLFALSTPRKHSRKEYYNTREDRSVRTIYRPSKDASISAASSSTKGQRQLLPIPGNETHPGPHPIISPLQFPGILNPDVYIQNIQSAPLFPEMKSPPVHMNLKIDGLKDYYNPKPPVIHNVHYYKPPTDPIKTLYNV